MQEEVEIPYQTKTEPKSQVKIIKPGTGFLSFPSSRFILKDTESQKTS